MIKLEAALALAPDPVRGSARSAFRSVEDAERLRERLRLANAEYERLASMADGWWHVSSAIGRAGRARVLLYRLGPERFTDRVLLAWTRSSARRRIRSLASARDACRRAGARRSFPLKAADFIGRGIAPGPRLGAALAAAEEAWIAAGFPDDAAALAAIADAAARRGEVVIPAPLLMPA